MTFRWTKWERWGSYLQHPVRQIHQLPLVLGDLGDGGRLILLQFTDVTGDNLQVQISEWQQLLTCLEFLPWQHFFLLNPTSWKQSLGRNLVSIFQLLLNSNRGGMRTQICSAPDLPAEEVTEARPPLYVRVSWQQATGVWRSDGVNSLTTKLVLQSSNKREISNISIHRKTQQDQTVIW